MNVDWVAVGSVATVLAVVVALTIAIWGDWLGSIASRPTLTLSIAMKPPDCHRIQTTVQIPVSAPGITNAPYFATQIKSFDTYYLRLSVGNSGSAPARGVEVRALELSRHDAATNAYKIDPHFSPLNLTWAHVGGTVAQKIDPELSKHCDLAHIDEPDSKLLKLNTEVVPNEVAAGVWPTIKPSGHYRLRLAITADNSKPVYRTLSITFAGQWFKTEEDMFTKGIVVRVES